MKAVKWKQQTIAYRKTILSRIAESGKVILRVPKSLWWTWTMPWTEGRVIQKGDPGYDEAEGVEFVEHDYPLRCYFRTNEDGEMKPVFVNPSYAEKP